MILRDTLCVNERGHLSIGGVDCVDLAERFGTALYVMDETYIRRICRAYRKIFTEKYPNGLVCYASKAFSAKAIYSLVSSEGLGADVVSGGELFTALSAGMDPSTLYFHGNNKLPYEIDMALRNDVHAIVADGYDDIRLFEDAYRRTGKKARVLLRVNPGVEAHTHQFIQTANVDSKFGILIGEQAKDLIKSLVASEAVEFLGLHCHIGSQIFELQPFTVAIDKMTDFIADLAKDGISVAELNVGGGYGITYTSADKPLEPEQYVNAIVDKLLDCIATKGITAPRLIIEPGRSIVGAAGITLYTIGVIKEIPGIRKYAAVDGGMYDNIRPALYQAEYCAMLANRATEEASETVTIAGKCCESGDILIKDAKLPPVKNGDLLAVFSTGAYNYSMASHYNRNFIPPVVLVCNGQADYIVRPETLEDIVARDVIPEWLK